MQNQKWKKYKSYVVWVKYEIVWLGLNMDAVLYVWMCVCFAICVLCGCDIICVGRVWLKERFIGELQFGPDLVYMLNFEGCVSFAFFSVLCNELMYVDEFIWNAVMVKGMLVLFNVLVKIEKNQISRQVLY